MTKKRSTTTKPKVLHARDDSHEFDEPDWAPLIGLVGKDLAGWFMWMGAFVLEDGTRVHDYKHCANRRNAHIADDGRCFAFEWDGRVETVHQEHGYYEISRLSTVDGLFKGWLHHDELEQPDIDRCIEAARILAFNGERFHVDLDELRRQRERELEQARADREDAAAA